MYPIGYFVEVGTNVIGKHLFAVLRYVQLILTASPNIVRRGGHYSLRCPSSDTVYRGRGSLGLYPHALCPIYSVVAVVTAVILHDLARCCVVGTKVCAVLRIEFRAL